MRFVIFAATRLSQRLQKNPLKVFFILVCAALVGSGIEAQTWPSHSDWVKGRSGASSVRILNSNGPLPITGSRQLFGIEFQLTGDWHVYWKNPGDTGFPPRLQWKLPEGWSAEEYLFPTPVRKLTETLGVVNGYAKSVIFPVYIQTGTKPGDYQIELSIDYLVCHIQCVPEKAELRLPFLKVTSAEMALISSETARLESALKRLPRPGSADIKMISPKNYRISIKTDQKVEDLFIASSQKLKGLKISRISDQDFEVVANQTFSSFEWVASIVGDGGLQGAYTLSDSTGVNSESEPITLWIALLLAFIGGAILNLMPCVLPVVVLKTIGLMKLSSAQPKAIRKSLLTTSAGILVSFGVLAVIFISLQSVGRQVGWGFHFQSPIFVACMSLLLFTFALNLFDVFEFRLGSSTNSKLAASSQGPFLEGVFATLLATPCSAPFLGTALTFAFAQPAAILFLILLFMGLGLSTPYLLLTIFPEALKYFPKPGAWMDGLKRVMGYSLLLALVWLLYILQQQVGSIALIFSALIFLLIFISLREFKGGLKWALVFLFALIFAVSIDRLQTKTSAENHVSMTTFSEADLKARLEGGETLYVVVTADWCLTCKYNENFVMKTDWFQKLLSENQVVEVVYDWTSRDDQIGSFLSSYNRVAIPFSMLISKDKTVLFPELLTEENVREGFKKFFQK